MTPNVFFRSGEFHEVVTIHNQEQTCQIFIVVREQESLAKLMDQIMGWMLYQLARSAITRCYRFGVLNNIHLFSDSFGSQNYEIKVSVGLLSSESLSLWLSSSSVFIWSFFYVCLCLASSYKDTSHTGLESTHMTSFYLDHLFTGPTPNTVTF